MTDEATILLVEDDPALLDGIADLLELANLSFGVHVLKASNGVRGLAVLGEQVPDLIISDIMMPEMDGFEFLRHVRDNPAWVHVPFIFLTARGTEKDVLEGRLSGAELYITKPYDSDELLELVGSQLDRAIELQVDRQQKLELLSRNIIQLLNHELRTPLTYVMAYYEMLADGLQNEGADSLQEYLRGIQVGANRLTRLVEDFVKVMELRTGEALAKYENSAGPIDNLSQLLKEVCRQYSHGRYEGPVEVHCNIPESLPTVYGDADSLQDVLRKILDNSVKFSSYQRNVLPAIVVSAGTREGEVWFSVKDNGIGFPAYVERRIFELFFQHNREQLEQQGAGTGLTIAKGLVDLHGGQISVESFENEGSTFEVALPCYEVGANGSRPVAAPARRVKRPATVLIVEDEEHLLEGLRDLLEILESDYELTILTASDGVEGLLKLAETQPDLVISDIMMPSMDGYEFLKNVRQNPAWVHIPFIFLTAKGERQDIMRGRRSGAEEYVTKPYDGIELFNLVVTQLDRHFEKQGVVQQDFEQLRRGILDLLLPNFLMPLTDVSDHSQNLAASLEQAQTDEALMASLRGIQVGSSQVSRLVEDFIFLAEFQTGEAATAIELRARPTNANEILEEVGNKYQHGVGGTQLHFSRFFDPNLPETLIDRDGLAKLIERLIEAGNELWMNGQKKGIYLASSSDEDSICLRVGSTDNALSPDTIERMSDLFARTELTGSTLSEYDLGLLTAKGIAELHQGQIALENKAGGGSAFVVTLPIVASERVISG